MRRRPRDIGTDAERAVVRYLRTAGWPHAERRALRGTQDAGDITGTPGICWEVKGGAAARLASDAQVEQWLEETQHERANADADIGVLVLARKGIGAANAGRWWAILPSWHYGVLLAEHVVGSGNTDPVRVHLSHACGLLVAAGYGSAQ